jgi:hydroxyacylglutathione hydrolase
MTIQLQGVPMLKYQIVPVTPFAQNCSVIWCDKTCKAAVVDPGGDVSRILAVVKKNNLELEKILLTHAHIDHAGGTAELSETAKVPIEGPEWEDKFWIDALPQQSEMFGFPQVGMFVPERWLKEGDQCTVGEEVLEVYHCPGHTPGHVIFYSSGSKLALVGDVLFNGSVGRTDFPRGDHATLINSIKTKLLPLGDDVSFIPGHGPMSTFGYERRTNPFVRE